MNSNGIDYRYLRAFRLTAEYKSFSKAAEELGIAQSAVSRQIKLLEESMSLQLIVRSSKKVILTEKGKELLGHIIKFDEMTKEIAEQNLPKTVRVGILHGLLETWFIKVIKTFSKDSIHNLKLTVETPLNLKEDLLEGKLDLIFTTENIQSDLITSLRLFEEKLVIISSSPIDLKKIEQYPWLTYNEHDFLFDLYKKHSEKIMTIASMTSIIKLVQEGVGIAIVPEHTLSDQKLHRYEVKGLKRPQIYLATLNYQELPQALKEIKCVILSQTPHQKT